MYIIVECFPCPEMATLVTDPETGENMVFEYRQDAADEAGKLQDGKIVEL